MEDVKLLEAPKEMKLIESTSADAPVHAPPETLKEYLAKRKLRKARMTRPTIRQKINTLAKDMRDAGIRYLTPRQLYGKRYNAKMWSGYYSYLIETTRRAL